MKRIRKIIKIFIISILITIAVTFGIFTIVFLTPPTTELDQVKLVTTSDFTVFYDRHNNEIECVDSNSYVKLNEIPKQTINAFIAIEDKNFYSHKGVDYKRMFGAALSNIKHLSYAEGASTITQQLIKNTHLTQEKTLSRKINEIKLAKQLERQYTKDEILEMYLNTIYFGENCYGIEKASRIYFSKSVSELDLNESATLAAIIVAPSKLNPINGYTECKNRRNLVLEVMYNQGYITIENVNSTKNSEINLNINDNYVTDKNFLKGVFTEFNKLKSDKPYTMKNVKVYTAFDPLAQEQIVKTKPNISTDYQAMIIENESRFVTAYYSTCGEISRSPASTAKSWLVYAPALEEEVINCYTLINDEKTDFNGYSPSNYNNKYYGQVSVHKSLALSLNVPAVKILNSLGVENAKKYAKLMNIEIQSNSLGIALGAFENQITLKSLLNAYTVFPNYGEYKDACYIKEIKDLNNKTIYKANDKIKRVFSEGTATIINEMLTETATVGTARSLSQLGFQVCAKTGTNGTSEGNFDAYSVAYTSDHTFGVWVGNADYSAMDNKVTGSNQPTFALRSILKSVYKQKQPAPLQLKGITEVEIDKNLYESSGEILIASENTPEKYTLKCKFISGTEPQIHSMNFEQPKILDCKLNFNDSNVKISYKLADYQKVVIKRVFNGIESTVYDGNDEFTDHLTDFGLYRYYVTPYIQGKSKMIYGETVTLPQVNFQNVKNKQITPPPDNWWDS